MATVNPNNVPDEILVQIFRLMLLDASGQVHINYINSKELHYGHRSVMLVDKRFDRIASDIFYGEHTLVFRDPAKDLPLFLSCARRRTLGSIRSVELHWKRAISWAMELYREGLDLLVTCKSLRRLKIEAIWMTHPCLTALSRFRCDTLVIPPFTTNVKSIKERLETVKEIVESKQRRKPAQEKWVGVPIDEKLRILGAVYFLRGDPTQDGSVVEQPATKRRRL